MNIASFSTHAFERPYLENANTDQHDVRYIEEALDTETADRAEGCKVVLLFSSDKANRSVLQKFERMGIKLISTRSAGTDHIDLEAAEELGIAVTNVPEYSPNAIAEHCIALTLALYRKLKPSFAQIEQYDFSLEGLVGQEIHNKIVGICGTGDIGETLARLFHGFGTELLLFDAKVNPNLEKEDFCKYVTKEELFRSCDIISLNLPLNEDTDYFVSKEELDQMKESAILLNTGRGRLVDTEAVLEALDNQGIAGFAMDVYEREEGIFYRDASTSDTKDERLQSLINKDNVIVTAHQAFLTDTALQNMMETTFHNIRQFESGSTLENRIA